MSGHSKWKTIKNAKAATDKKRGALFTKLIREITVAAKQGGGDPDGNPRLRTAIENARAQSLPKDNIERAVKKGTGDLEGADYVDVVYEAYGPGGVGIMIQALTDNATRTVAEVRAKLVRGGGKMATTNAVAIKFDRKGQIFVEAAGLEEDSAMEKALEAGAEDFVKEDDTFIITTAPADLHTVKQALDAAGLKAGQAEMSWIPKNTVPVSGEPAALLLKLIESLEELDDVQKVDADFEMDESEMAGA